MIIEIEISKDAHLFDCYPKLISLGNFIIENHVVYLDTIKDISTVSQSLPIKKCSYITSTNYKDIGSSFCRKWCQEILYKHELQEFEKTVECQNRLKLINKQLDLLEEGGMDIAKKKSANDHNSS